MRHENSKKHRRNTIRRAIVAAKVYLIQAWQMYGSTSCTLGSSTPCHQASVRRLFTPRTEAALLDALSSGHGRVFTRFVSSPNPLRQSTSWCAQASPEFALHCWPSRSGIPPLAHHWPRKCCSPIGATALTGP